ncbi:MAG: phosphate ABC transporter substrate-binding protein, partial [Actinomycetota bacterium]
YAPLARPLYIYVDKKSWAKPEMKAFVTFYIEQDAKIAEAAKYIPLSEEQKKKAQEELTALG